MMNENQTRSPRPRVLAVDDDKSLGETLKRLLADEFDIEHVESGKAAMGALYGTTFDGVLLDMHLPDIYGMELLKFIKAKYQDIPVVMLTSEGGSKTIVDSIKTGAFNYVIKDTATQEAEIRFQLNQAIEFQRLKGHSKNLEVKVKQHAKNYEIVGITPMIARLQNAIRALRGTQATVLINGETGTGKELVARALNAQEKEGTSRPFQAVNCGAIPENLAESELFGHEKGAFTGATQRQHGKFFLADGGDILLDEIGELPLLLQTKLLRVLQERVITPVGAAKPIPINVRVIAATHKDLKEEIRQGRFREDLYYRLNVMEISVPSLRERKEDIPILVNHFLKEFGMPNTQLTKDAMEKMKQHPWPGNIRALRNCIERASIFARINNDRYITIENLLFVDATVNPKTDPRIPENFLAFEQSELNPEHYQAFLNWAEKTYLQTAYSVAGENKSRLSEKLGLSRDCIHRKFKTLGLSEPSKESAKC